MSHVALVCGLCGPADKVAPIALACEGCGGPLDLAYNTSAKESRKRPADTESLPGIWRFWDRLPLHHEGNIISLGEGSTPCVHLERIGRRLGLEQLYGKVEYANPTGSFKDRGASVMLSMFKELGFSEVVDDSSGNAGAALSAYAARGGMRAIVFVPASASPYKIDQIRFYGAELRPIQATREGVAAATREFVEGWGGVYASHNSSPYFIEGMKSFAYESVKQVPAPIQHVVVPVGNGSLLLGAERGFAELLEDGEVSQLPQLHCIQAQACMPLVAACQGIEWTPDQARPTMAGGIVATVPPRGRQVVQAVRATGGTAAAVEEERILEWQRTLARDEGLFIEPTSAAAFAGLDILVSQGAIRPHEVTLVPITGFGLKDRVPEA